MKNVWVTGAGKGLGRAAAMVLAQRGIKVAVSARTADDLDAAKSDAIGLSGSIHPFPLDVTDVAATAKTFAAVEAALGELDLVILNAGTHIPVDVKNLDVAPFRKLIEVNYMGVVNGLVPAARAFVERRRGHIAVVASVAGYCGLPSASAYGASKAALINMCEALKPDLDRNGVRLTLVNPGFVKTPLTDKNDFEMPFLMEVDAAAKRLVDGLQRGGFETTFPRRFTWGMKVLRALPYPLFFAITAKYLTR